MQTHTVEHPTNWYSPKYRWWCQINESLSLTNESLSDTISTNKHIKRFLRFGIHTNLSSTAAGVVKADRLAFRQWSVRLEKY